MNELLLEVKDLHTYFRTDDGVVKAVSGVDFAINKGALPYPVQGKVVSRFGPKQHKIFGTKIRNNGIEIATDPLSAVVTVYPGYHEELFHRSFPWIAPKGTT